MTWVRLFHILALTWLVAGAAPQVKMGKTTITGRDITDLKLDFFGGVYRVPLPLLCGGEVTQYNVSLAGIPFARPPLGPLRLQPPVLQTKLNSATFDATNFGKACLQPVGLFPVIDIILLTLTTLKVGDLNTLSEDCLTLNIYRPSGIRPNAKLPVVRH